MKIWLIMIIMTVGCASNRNCPDEAVSICRAKQECGNGGISAFAMVLGGIGSGLSGQRNQANDQYNRCIDNSLRAQRNNTGTVGPANTADVKCETERISDTEVITKCHAI